MSSMEGNAKKWRNLPKGTATKWSKSPIEANGLRGAKYVKCAALQHKGSSGA